jgi:hypothetical protein
MTVNPKTVVGRRVVHYTCYDDLLDDAERLTQQPVETIGNWNQAQIYHHLAMSLNSSIDGSPFALPAPVRWLMSLFMKRRFLKAPLPAGFKTTPEFDPRADISVENAFGDLRMAIQRVQSEPARAKHPGFGNISRQEWDAFNLRHAELHMSFLKPAER